MKRLLLVFAPLLLVGCSVVSTTNLTRTIQAPSSSSACHIRGKLPDPTCTPGARNPDVTQATIGSTICVRGWTATIRPPVSVTNALKRKQIALYGYADHNLAHYEEDHLVSLELGGAPSDPRNLWPEPGPSPNPKDRIEGLLRRRVCADTMTLAAAQHAIATDWTAVH